MPLTNLFKKRHSLETSLVQNTNKELDKLKSSSRKIETIKAQSESNLMASDLDIDMSVSNTESILLSSSATAAEDFSIKYEYIEQDRVDSPLFEKDSCSDIRRQSAPVESFKRTEIKTGKLVPCDDQKFSPKITTTRRRKCASESQAGDLESNEKDDGRTFEIDEGKLEDMIGQCINRIIKESILTAVQKVNVDGICEEILDNISSRRLNSIDAGACNENKYFSDVDEYAEINESNLNYRSGENEESDSLVYEDSVISLNPEDKKTETHSLGGYSADLEESMSIHSTDTEMKEQTTSCGSFSGNKNNCENTNVAEDCSATHAQCDKINHTEESQPSIDGESAPLAVSETERTNVMHETKIAKNSFKDEPIYSNVENLEQDVNVNTGSEDDHQAQDSADTTNIREIRRCDSSDDILKNESDLMIVSDDIDSFTLPKSPLSHRDSNDSVIDSIETLPPQQACISEEKKTNNWRLGYLHVKLPHKERGKKAHLKAWKKRCVSIQTDEFVNDPKNPCLMLSLYSAESGTARKHGATFWKSISCHKAAVYRSCSRSHKYAFTISDDNNIVIHLAAESETSSQEWMAAIRSILWPPSPVLQLEKMLYGKQFEISIVDNEFSFRAGLLGMYGYLTITEKKLILVHPQQGYVIQEWYLNTVDKFELMPQTKIEDAHKVLSMTTCSDSSTGRGEILMYCPEAVALLQSIASTIHQILTVHIEQKGGKYEKELAEIADWLVPETTQDGESPEDYYKVPPRQVKSLLDIPNFIFDKPLTPSTTVTCCSDESMESKSLETAKTNLTRASQDSGISAGNTSEDILNCSSTSFIVGAGQFPGKSSDSELSDSYTPPRSPIIENKQKRIATSARLRIP